MKVITITMLLCGALCVDFGATMRRMPQTIQEGQTQLNGSNFARCSTSRLTYRQRVALRCWLRNSPNFPEGFRDIPVGTEVTSAISGIQTDADPAELNDGVDWEAEREQQMEYWERP